MSVPTISLASPTLSAELLSVASLPASTSTSTSAVPTIAGSGFFYLIDHGVPLDLISGTFSASADYFEKETLEEKKKTIDRTANTGWTEVGAESLDPNNPDSKKAGDAKESFYVSPSVNPERPAAPAQTLPPTLKAHHETLATIMGHCQRVSQSLLSAFEESLGVEAGRFTKEHKDSTDDRLRLIRYPGQKSTASSQAEEAAIIRAGAHTDYGSLTLLFQSSVGGLQVQRGDTTHSSSSDVVGPAASQWLDVPPRPGSIVINIGDALDFWTRGLLPSTLHRVVSPRTEAEREQRYSMAYFVQPDPQASLDPIPVQRLREELRERVPERTQWLAKCRAKGIPTEAIEAEDHLQQPQTATTTTTKKTTTITGGEYLRRRLDASYRPTPKPVAV